MATSAPTTLVVILLLMINARSMALSILPPRPNRPIDWRFSNEWTPIVNGCIYEQNNRVEDDVLSMDDCKFYCEIETTFTCRSVELNNQRCVLSDANSQSNHYEQPCTQPGWRYSEVIYGSSQQNRVPTRQSGNCPWTGSVCITGVGVYRNGPCANGEHQRVDSCDTYANLCTCCVRT